MSNFKLKLKRVSALKFGIITGVVMALLALIILVLSYLSSSFLSFSSRMVLKMFFSDGISTILFVPLELLVLGFISGWIGAIFLNVILSKTGGLNLEFEKSDSIDEI